MTRRESMREVDPRGGGKMIRLRSMHFRKRATATVSLIGGTTIRIESSPEEGPTVWAALRSARLQPKTWTTLNPLEGTSPFAAAELQIGPDLQGSHEREALAVEAVKEALKMGGIRVVGGPRT